MSYLVICLFAAAAVLIAQDSDGDGFPDSKELFPFDSGMTVDSDRDGVDDALDRFPNDAWNGTNTNVALGKPVKASSGQSSAHYVVDGHIEATDESLNKWIPSSSTREWISIDLGAPVPIKRIYITWYGVGAKTYDIQVSNDETAWQTIYAGTDGSDESLHLRFYHENHVARYVKWTGYQRNISVGTWPYNMREFEVYSSAVSDFPANHTGRFIDFQPHPNVALGKHAYASRYSTESTTRTHSPDMAVDGEIDKTVGNWSAGRYNIATDWLAVDLGEAYAIDGISIVFLSNLPKRFQVVVSDDNRTWYPVYTAVNHNDFKSNTEVYLWDGNPETHRVSARYVKMQGQEANTWSTWGYAIHELRVYGEPAGAVRQDNAGRTAIPTAVEIEARPNPFRSVTDITLRAAFPGAGYRLGIYDLTGRLLGSFDGPGGPVRWNASTYSPGIYLVRVHAGGRIITKRLSLLK